MVPVPKLESNTVRRIYKFYAERNSEWDALGINLSDAGKECDRALWYALRWASASEEIPGRMQRRFDTGNREEARLIADLGSVGVNVKERQARVSLIGGHLRGKIDGRATGVIEAPVTEHLIETKAVNLKTYRALDRYKVKDAKPEHYAQCQLGMHALSLTRCLYLATCTDDDVIYSERIEYDIYYASAMVSRLMRIVTMNNPPAGICKNESDHRGTFCKQRAPCMNGELMRHSCRSCIFAKAETDGDATWSCERHETRLTTEEQKAACPHHRNIPATVPGEQIDVIVETNVIVYRMPDGTIWHDGDEEK